MGIIGITARVVLQEMKKSIPTLPAQRNRFLANVKIFSPAAVFATFTSLVSLEMRSPTLFCSKKVIS